MLTHAQIWSAIDRLAERYGLTASGLARRAGLDATSFNRSKRVSPDGRERWPSTESIAKVLAATGASLSEFVALVEDGDAPRPTTVPIVPWDEVGQRGQFGADGLPSSPKHEEIEFPDTGAEKLLAVEVSGDALVPLCRDGDVLIVSPTTALRKGDRLLVRFGDGSVGVRELIRRTVRTLEMRGLAEGSADEPVPVSDVLWIARILWIRQ